jgi:CheY-like chemotaxis protein
MASASPHQTTLQTRILLVDDDPETLRITERLLARKGFEVVAVASYQSALDAAAMRSFDFVLSDIGLPDGSGLELMSVLKSRFQLKGIAISGYGMAKDREQSRQAGFAAHLVKPVTMHDVETAIDRIRSENGSA